MSIMDPAALPLAKKVLERVTNDPEHFDMSDWFYLKSYEDPGEFCNTSACLAGWAMILSGEFELDEYGIPIYDEDASFEEACARLLGIPRSEACNKYDDHGYLVHRGLFYSGEDSAIERLQELINEAEAEA